LYARALTIRSTASLYGLRLVSVILGTLLGESWMPVALTGNIATGKSTVARRLAMIETRTTYNNNDDDSNEKGEKKQDNDTTTISTNPYAAYIVDADKIGHDIYLRTTPGNVYNYIVNVFGTDILTTEKREIDRTKLGSKIFNDTKLRRQLNRLTHPTILSKILRSLAYGVFFSGCDIVIGDIPLLFESGKMPWLFCIIVVVSCSPERQIERLKRRNPEISEEERRARIDSQMSLLQKINRADYRHR